MSISAYNSLTQKKEPVEPRDGKLNMFVCGPTVYDYSHLGHARTYIAFDMISRWLRESGTNVFYLQNITDIDDKIITRAQELGKDPRSLAEHFEKEYYEDMRALKIAGVTKYARATDHIDEIVSQVQTLVAKGNAYKIENDGYYFDLSTFPDYGKLSRRTLTQAEDAVTRIDEGVGKRNKGDFCLWKFSKEGEPAWNTPLGSGRPGWHIEDTAISEKYFGPQYDIHGGAVDLKFPHHEAEIAQQESASGKKPFVRHWLHTGFLLIRGQKMSKSLGNFITIRDFLVDQEPGVLRLMVLSSHYRSPLDYTDELAAAARASLASIREFIARTRFVGRKSTTKTASQNIPQIIRTMSVAFSDAMNDDFNTPVAIAALHQCMRAIEKDLFSLSPTDAAAVADALIRFADIIGISIDAAPVPDAIESLAANREKFRAEKNWTAADSVRQDIERKGYAVEDTPLGPFVIKK